MDYKKEIAEIIKIEGFSVDEIKNIIEEPKDYTKGDFALPCFRFSKQFKKAPIEIANEIIKNIVKPDFIESIENIGGFINFKLNKRVFIKDTINQIVKDKENYGQSKKGENKNICVDYSSINIAKPLHIGHLMSTVIGNSVCKIGRKLGYNMIGINHLGDWGTQFGKLIVAYRKWGSKEEVEKEGVKALNKYYVKFHEEEESQGESSQLSNQGREWFKRIEDGDKQAVEYFEWFKEITLKEVDKTYKKLGVEFEYYTGESFYNDKMEAVVKELEEKKITQESNDATIVRFLDDQNNEKMPICIVKRSDGASLYITRDLAAAFYRKKEFNFHKALYVVAYQQNLHFMQLFEIIRMLGYDWYKDMAHVPFGMVSLSSGSIATRKGRVVLLEDVLNNTVKQALSTIEEKNPTLSNKEEIAKKIGIGAVVFWALKSSRIKDVLFDQKQMLSFEGETGPYIQYAITRCNSLLKDNAPKRVKISGEHLNNTEGFLLSKQLYAFPRIIEESFDKYEPSIISHYLIETTKAFNKYYSEHRFVVENEAEKEEKMQLALAAKTVLEEGMRLLGIACPAQM